MGGRRLRDHDDRRREREDEGDRVGRAAQSRDVDLDRRSPDLRLAISSLGGYDVLSKRSEIDGWGVAVQRRVGAAAQ